MKTGSDFELEEAVRAWRRGLDRREEIAAGAADELEVHLREQVDDLVVRGGAGLSEEEAFLVAAKRAGAPGELAVEFAAADPGRVWLVRLFWFVFGFFEISALLALVAALGKVIVLLAAWLGAGEALPWVAAAAHGGLFLGFAAVVGIAWRRVARHGLEGFEWFEGVVLDHPVRVASVALLVIGGLHGAALLARVGLARMVDLETLGRTSLSLSYYGTFSAVALFAGLAAALVLAGRRLNGRRLA